MRALLLVELFNPSYLPRPWLRKKAVFQLVHVIVPHFTAMPDHAGFLGILGLMLSKFL